MGRKRKSALEEWQFHQGRRIKMVVYIITDGKKKAIVDFEIIVKLKHRGD